MNERFNAKILVVDDEETFRDYFQEIFTSWGLKVRTAANYKQAKNLITENYFHAISIDIRLVEKDPNNEEGMSLLKLINQYHEPTATFIVTGHPSGERYRRAFKDLQVTDFLEKRAIDKNELRKIITDAYINGKNILDDEKDALRNEVYTLVKGYDIYKFERETLGKENAVLIGSIVSGLMIHTYPFILSNRFTKIINDNRSPFLETSFWSRMYGKPYTIRIGRTEQIEYEYEKLTSNSNIDVFRNTKEDLSGIRFVANDLTIKDFGNE